VAQSKFDFAHHRVGFAWFSFVTDSHAELGAKVSVRRSCAWASPSFTRLMQRGPASFSLVNRSLVELFWQIDSVEGTVDQLSSQVCVPIEAVARMYHHNLLH
jgi:hypothetical protein